MNARIFSVKISISLLLIFMFLSGYLFCYQRKTDFTRKWIPNSVTLETKTIQRRKPVNNLTYPVFKHPLAPPYPYPYNFILNQPDKCKNRTPFLVLMVLVESQDIMSRHTIRETWGNESLYDVDVVRVFLVGQPVHIPDQTQLLLEEEKEVFGDIIQQDFMDTYYNLTLKTLLGIEWVTKFCPSASYVMKIDNDMFVNVDYLVHQLLRPDLPVLQNYFTGFIVFNGSPYRDASSKWYLPKEVYPNDTFPPYCAGPGYVFSVDMAQKIYDVSQNIRVIPMEDVFMGVCLYELRIPPTKPPPGIFNGLRIDYDLCTFKKVVTVHKYKREELKTLWADFWSKKSQTC
ncbi:beta-1,3-galactosyltransferase 2-like [Hyla sarda]|uniref:beta-1,3-galactosyltransferase 2-like n=1 Tax=Hyla sarda TaxID=327740 RepID=UPI0024C2E486|nr:beta-1,3-galactosyltransferase 2-like [Hyla sarda]XP_056426503.1 beta-1,3-galactosyltransferase 2-like [Hyla sarda]XP_056426504.1 beta-1,3-galactosyltransferase 2-like [Hyla sarda]XP_056426505.1 beta-1,3-galactosyltransferase 2-like [Hyla sarda]